MKYFLIPLILFSLASPLAFADPVRVTWELSDQSTTGDPFPTSAYAGVRVFVDGVENKTLDFSAGDPLNTTVLDLPPGQYEIQLQAVSNYGVESELSDPYTLNTTTPNPPIVIPFTITVTVN